MDVTKEYLNIKPSKKLRILNIEIPCDTECLKNSNFKELLNNEFFKEQLEILDSLENLINDNINTLLQELEFRFSKYSVNLEDLAYTVYKIIEEGGNVIVGSNNIIFEEKIIAKSTEFNSLYEISKLIDEIRNDENIRSLCDEIKYLTESLWEHFNKNLRRALNES
ncbi:hypothetical protein [Acidianus sp. HS-5]|uniref:hypothetical protein n=1 Tax=Acidianus sp. HS-5 TaxID=2886040 RepID=UPI001F465A8A|nr:hypothetical protein [Acidianus sp. HS-5]BDC18127.1 hypothetical protein HS5_10170 [Acidianus sp. HS-5]